MSAPPLAHGGITPRQLVLCLDAVVCALEREDNPVDKALCALMQEWLDGYFHEHQWVGWQEQQAAVKALNDAPEVFGGER